VRINYVLLLMLALEIQTSSCHTRRATIVHVKFCDYLNDVSNQSDKLHGTLLQSKSLHYVIQGKNPANWDDSLVNGFIRSDSFLQSEIKKQYYDLTISFYKKTNNTDFLLWSGKDKFLSDCYMDRVVECEWTNGGQMQLYHYHDGIIEGAENIKLEDVH
jgi:hypothetical protein